MKKFFNYLMYAGLLVIGLNLISCQDEFEELPNGDEQETIMASSSTAKLLEHTSSNDGSYDNIVDGASCFAVQFPYSVNVNGLDLTIDSVEDLHLIEGIFDEFEVDEDILDIIFPITITLGDYTEIVINSKDDLRAIAEECQEGGDDDDIECIDFVYPITLYTFDINEQQTGSVVVENDEQMRRFFAGLDDNDLISIDFPVTLKLFDGTTIVVDSNAEMANAIENAKDACDEDDDNDYNDDDFTKDRLDSYLVECPWLIHEVERDNLSQTDQYFEYLMNFSENGGVEVKDRQGNVLMGTWSTRISDHGVLLKLEFDVLVDFTLEWFVYDIGEGKIKLYSEGGNRIIMKRLCDAVNDDPNTLREILKECSWIIKKVKNNGVEIDRLLGWEFNFEAEGVVTLSNGESTSEGIWAITANPQGRLVMAITMGNEPGVSFEWPLSDLRNDRLKFEIEGTDYELILQRDCNGNDEGDVPGIRNIMMEGEWIVAQYKDDGMDETGNYEGFDFAFSPANSPSGIVQEHQVVVSMNGDPMVYGIWRILRNSDGQLKFYLNLIDEQTGVANDIFVELTDDWDIVSVTADRIELRDVSGSNESTDTLVFERK